MRDLKIYLNYEVRKIFLSSKINGYVNIIVSLKILL